MRGLVALILIGVLAWAAVVFGGPWLKGHLDEKWQDVFGSEESTEPDAEASIAPDAPWDAKLAGALDTYIYTNGADTRNEAFATLQTIAERNPNELAKLLRREYGEILLDPQSDAGDGHDDVRARAILFALAGEGQADLVARYLRPGCDAGVIFALAEAYGVKLYYGLMEGAGADQRVTPAEAADIMLASPHFKPHHEILREYREGLVANSE
jgi:hypothetical protein